MEPARASPDDRATVRPGAWLGDDVRRWIQEADDRLTRLDARETGVPRADDFGHVTTSRGSPRAAPRGPAPVAASAPAPERGPAPSSGGIVVAAGWGGRSRA